MRNHMRDRDQKKKILIHYKCECDRVSLWLKLNVLNTVKENFYLSVRVNYKKYKWLPFGSNYITHDTIILQVVFYKRINKVFFTDTIPKAPSGKILRKDLRAKLAAGFPN